MGRLIGIAPTVVTVGVLLIGFLVHGVDAIPQTTYSLEPRYDADQVLSRINLHRQLSAISPNVTLQTTPNLLGTNGEIQEYVTVTFTKSSGAAADDWVGLFSPAKFDGSQCLKDLNLTNEDNHPPYICQAPLKFQFANYSSPDYVKNGEGSLSFLVINQRSDYAFGFFSGGTANPVLEAISNTFQFKNPKAPVWPRLAVGKEWDTITVTWTSGYSDGEARPVVKWKFEEDKHFTETYGVTLTYARHDMCGPPASTVGYRDPGYTHTVFLKSLAAISSYTYQFGHKLKSGGYVWGPVNSFRTAPYPGQDSVQKIVIFGDMGKHEKDGSTEYVDTQAGALLVTDALEKDIADIDIIIHNGDIVYANGYISEWDQFADQISNVTNRVPWMMSAGNHERDWPGTGSFYQTTDCGGECGVVQSTMYRMPAKNKDKFWYAFDWGKFHFCVANSEMDWLKGSEQYKFLEECFAQVDRASQPWLIFVAHRVLGYSSGSDYQTLGSFAEPMARQNLEYLWQKYKVDIGIYGHVHNYERTCPVYEDNCVSTETTNYAGHYNATIHLVVGTGGRDTDAYGLLNTSWSIVKDYSLSYGYMKFTSVDSESLVVDFIHANDSSVYDTFNFKRKFTDVLGCDSSLAPICPPVTLADL